MRLAGRLSAGWKATSRETREWRRLDVRGEGGEHKPRLYGQGYRQLQLSGAACNGAGCGPYSGNRPISVIQPLMAPALRAHSICARGS